MAKSCFTLIVFKISFFDIQGYAVWCFNTIVESPQKVLLVFFTFGLVSCLFWTLGTKIFAVMKDDRYTTLKQKLAAVNLENASLVSQNASLRDQKNTLMSEKSVMRLSWEESDSAFKLLQTDCVKISENCHSINGFWLENNYEMMYLLNWENMLILKYSVYISYT